MAEYNTDLGSVYELEITEGTIKYKKNKYINEFTNPMLNINNLGERKVNGIITEGVEYDLIYNGTEWDILNYCVTGSYSGTTKGCKEIILPFKPSAVFVITSSLSILSAVGNETYGINITERGFKVVSESKNSRASSGSSYSYGSGKYIAFK